MVDLPTFGSPTIPQLKPIKIPSKKQRGTPEGPPFAGHGRTDFKSVPFYQIKSGAITRETMYISLINIFMAGPDVSLHGSPTVSPTTAALCASDFLPPRSEEHTSELQSLAYLV